MGDLKVGAESVGSITSITRVLVVTDDPYLGIGTLCYSNHLSPLGSFLPSKKSFFHSLSAKWRIRLYVPCYIVKYFAA